MKLLNFQIVKNTIQKEVRSRTLLFTFVMTLAIVYGGYTLIKVFELQSGNDQMLASVAPKTVGIMMWIINLWSAVLASMFAVNTISSDFRENRIQMLLSLPLGRNEYFLSRIFGTWLIIMSYYLLSYLLTFVLFSMGHGKIVGEATYLFVPVLMGLSLLPLIVVGVLFSFLMPKLPAFLFTLVFSGIATSVNQYYHQGYFLDQIKQVSLFNYVGIIFHTIFPRMGVLNLMMSKILLSGEYQFNYVMELIHFTLMAVCWIFLASKFFSKKEW